jgi:hypothetical protein
MQGYYLTNPIKINSKVPLPKDYRKNILQSLRSSRGVPCKWMYGHVDAVKLPDIFNKIYEHPVDFLNQSQTQIKWGNKESLESCDMVFGRGSIGTHTDEMTALTLLILLYCEPWVKKTSKPEFNGYNGEFISGDKVIEMEVGDSIVFDDRKPHAWLTNSAWAFASFPLIVSAS